MKKTTFTIVVLGIIASSFGVGYFKNRPADNTLSSSYVAIERTETNAVSEAEKAEQARTLDRARELAEQATTLSPLLDISQVENNAKYDVDEYVLNITTYLFVLPDKVYNQLISDGWKIILTESDESTATLYGRTNHRTKEIYLYADHLGFEWATLHEIGHVLYRHYAMDAFNAAGIRTCNAEELTAIYFHEGENRDYITGKTQEAIAQSYVEYLLYPAELKACSPTVYNIWWDTTAAICQ
jgi:hypothetical protein